MGKKSYIQQCIPFLGCPFTDDPVIHWLMLQDIIHDHPRRPILNDHVLYLRHNYGSGLTLINQACLRAEAMGSEDILFNPAGMHVLEVLYYGWFRDLDGQEYPIENFFKRSRDRLIEVSRVLCIPVRRIDLRAGEWPAAATFAEDVGITGAEFLRYAGEYSGFAIARLVIHEAASRYKVIMKGMSKAS